MTRFARALMAAAVAGGVTMTCLAFSGMQGGSGGGARGARGGGAHAVVIAPTRPGFFAHPGFARRPVFVGHPGFPFHRVVVWGGPVFYGPPPVVFVSGVPVLWYCQDPIGYFPSIQACPVGWIEMTQ